MAVATGIGSLPGEDYSEAVRIVLGELPDLPFVPELPARGPHAGLTGRSLAMVTELGFDLQPGGWRLTHAPGLDHRRARSLLAQDLDVVEEQLQGFAGELKVQVGGPWTLAATVERPRGDRLLADTGARRELAQALAAGLADHVEDLRRRLPGAALLVQVDEPALPAVLSGAVPTASGFHRHRSVDAPAASAALEEVFAAISREGVTSLAHCCADEPPIALLRGAGAGGISVDVTRLAATAYEPLAEAIDAGQRALLGVVPSLDSPLSRGAVEDRLQQLLDMLGFDPDAVSGQLVLTPACGLAAASPAYARRALGLLVEVSRGRS